MINTGFEHLSDIRFNHLFCDEEWIALSPRGRLNACQELENRLAEERGTRPRTVSEEPMEGGVYGYQFRDRIVMNSHLLTDCGFHVTDEETGQETVIGVDVAGWQVYDTVCHEDTHGMQQDEGRIQTARSYINYDTNPLLYRLQPSEREAFDRGMDKTREAMLEQQKVYGGLEEEIETYELVNQENDYESTLREAQSRYGENIQDELNRAVAERELRGRASNPVMERLYDRQQRMSTHDRADTWKNAHPEMPLSQQQNSTENIHTQNGETENARKTDTESKTEQVYFHSTQQTEIKHQDTQASTQTGNKAENKTFQPHAQYKGEDGAESLENPVRANNYKGEDGASALERSTSSEHYHGTDGSESMTGGHSPSYGNHHAATQSANEETQSSKNGESTGHSHMSTR